MPRLTETQASVLEDLLDSSGWAVLVSKIFMPYVDEQSAVVLSSLRSAGSEGSIGATAKYHLGKRDGAFDLLQRAYKDIGMELPAELKKAIRP